ncbi:transposase [Bradyrhizobium sp. 142]|uniref:IS4/Tn5 family transposase DNA-binding protein n=1 Tax=Bradyrhizobium sp. 142 TaxID=2782618 RepID=UPI001FF9E282|nr:transposase [Bradyrhizobium sp. 142]
MGLTLRDRSAKGCLRFLDGECWIDREISGCQFRDARLGDRFRKLLTQIGSAMGQSIPLVCQDWANTKAAYRFFSNDRVSEADLRRFAV